MIVEENRVIFMGVAEACTFKPVERKVADTSARSGAARIYTVSFDSLIGSMEDRL